MIPGGIVSIMTGNAKAMGGPSGPGATVGRRTGRNHIFQAYFAETRSIVWF
jgi:hypothetical protein